MQILLGQNQFDVRGTDFEIGIIRGRDLGGDWGVSFVRKSIADGSTSGALDNYCFTATNCFPIGRIAVDI